MRNFTGQGLMLFLILMALSIGAALAEQNMTGNMTMTSNTAGNMTMTGNPASNMTTTMANNMTSTMASSMTSSAANTANAANAVAKVVIIHALKEGTALHVIIANNGTAPADLTGWKLYNGTTIFVFPAFTLNPGATVTVHTHQGNNTATDLYGSNFYWNGTQTVTLMNSRSLLVSIYTLNQTS